MPLMKKFLKSVYHFSPKSIKPVFMFKYSFKYMLIKLVRTEVFEVFLKQRLVLIKIKADKNCNLPL